jgi:hypothetical protein
MAKQAKAKSAPKPAVPDRDEPERELPALEKSPARYSSANNTAFSIGLNPDPLSDLFDRITRPNSVATSSKLLHLTPASAWGATSAKNARSESLRAQIVVDLHFAEEMMNVFRMTRRDGVPKTDRIRKLVQILHCQIEYALEKWLGRIDDEDPLAARLTKLWRTWKGQVPALPISPLYETSAMFIQQAFYPNPSKCSVCDCCYGC